MEFEGSFNREELVKIVRQALAPQSDNLNHSLLFLCQKLDNIIERLNRIEQNQRTKQGPNNNGEQR